MAMPLVNNVAAAGSFTVLHSGDAPAAPRRLGEYFLEADMVQFVTGQPGAPEKLVGINLSSRWLMLVPPSAPGVAISLKRCEEPEV